MSASNWANRSKQAINAVELKPLTGGGGDRIDTFYNYVPRKDGTLSEGSKLFTVGEALRGTYEGSFESEGKSGKAKGKKFLTHKIKTEEGKLLGLSGSGLLNYIIKNKVTQGQLVEVIYNGRDDQDRHQFTVNG